jgi:hypothetical protein
MDIVYLHPQNNHTYAIQYHSKQCKKFTANNDSALMTRSSVDTIMIVMVLLCRGILVISCNQAGAIKNQDISELYSSLYNIGPIAFS